MYVLALSSFTKKKQNLIKAEKCKIAKNLQAANKEKNKLVLDRANLVKEGCYDEHSKDYFEKRLGELSKAIEKWKLRKEELSDEPTQKVLSFVRFLELIENLHHYWLTADYKQKEQISKNLLSNLTVSGQEVRSTSWLKPF